MYQVNFLPWRQRRERRRGYFWLGVLLLQLTALLLTLFLVAGQLRHQQAQRQARLAMLGEELAALTLQQLSSSIPPPLWLTAMESDAVNGLRLRGLSRSPAAITQFERRLAGMPALPRLRLAEVAQRDDGLYTFHLAAQWGRDG